MADFNDAIDEIVRRIVEAVQPDKIILFGSHARGEAGPDSDIDLLVIGPTDEPPTRRMKPVYRALRGLRVPKDVLWWTQEEVDEWREVPGHVIKHALREGKVVFGA